MFVLSQYIINAVGMGRGNTQTYSIALGLILYSSIYLYILFYNNDYLNIFNKFIVYIVIVDLLLSAFYYYSKQDTNDDDADDDAELLETADTENENTEYTSEITEDEDEKLDEELDEESQQYIENLINQAKMTELQRQSISKIEELEPELDEPELDEPELDLEPELDEPELDLEPELVEDAEVAKEIEHIIEDISTKKRQKKTTKKVQAQSVAVI